MSSAVQTSSQSATQPPESDKVQADIIKALRLLASQVDRRVELWKERTDSTTVFVAARQVLDIQIAAEPLALPWSTNSHVLSQRCAEKRALQTTILRPLTCTVGREMCITTY